MRAFLRAIRLLVLAALLLLPAAAQAAMTSRDLNAAFDELDALGAFFGAFAARETNDLARERWRRLSIGYPGTAGILRDLLAREHLILAELPKGRVSAVLDGGVIAIDRELDGSWSGELQSKEEAAEAARRRDLLLPVLFEALGRVQPPQDWPWLADHLRAVGGFGVLAQDPVARPLLARFFHAKDTYLWLALQRIGQGDPAARRALATRQAAMFDTVDGLATDLAATFGLEPADRLRRDWADYVAQVDGFAVSRGWLLLDPALSRTLLGEAVRSNADAVNRAAAEVVASAPRSAVAAARQDAAERQASRQGPKAPGGVTLDDVVAQAVAPELEVLAAALPLQALTVKPEADFGLDPAVVRAFLVRVEEAVAQQPALRAAIAEREQQLDAARAEVTTLESKVAALAAAAADRAAEAERLQAALQAEQARRAEIEAQLAAEAEQRQAALEAEQARRSEIEAQLAAREAAEAERLEAALAAERERLAAAEARRAALEAAEAERAVATQAEPAPLPQIAVLPPPVVAEPPAAAPSAADPRLLYALMALAAVVLLVVLASTARRWRPAAAAAPAPLLLTAPAADALAGDVLNEPPAPEPTAPEQTGAQPAAAPRRAPVRVNGVVPPTAAARAAMKAGTVRQAAAAAAPPPASESDTAAHPIVQALRQGNLPLFELLFGELTDLRTPQLQRIVYGGRGEDLAIVCRAVGVDKLLFGSIYMLTDHLRSGDVEEEAARTSEILQLYDRMPPATARKVLAKWQRDWGGQADEESAADV